METHLHSILTTVVLFFFGLMSPGPNFLVVTQTSLNFGRVAGFITGLGTALGDALYASLGLFGIARLLDVGHTMLLIEVLGGLYLEWLGMRMVIPRTVGAQVSGRHPVRDMSARSHFWRGLATDLSNPKTVVFFASIFAVTINPQCTRTIRAAMLMGIILTSIAWRFFLAIVFSTTFIRGVYERSAQVIERTFGLALCLFGLFLIKRAAW